MKRFDAWPRPGKTYVRRPGVYAILPCSAGILATFQGGIHNEYQLPGGGVDADEQPIAALHREVIEETGWRIDGVKLYTRFKRFVYMPDYDLWAEKICSIYVAKPVRRLGPPTEIDHRPIVLSPTKARSSLANSGDRNAVSAFFGLS